MKKELGQVFTPKWIVNLMLKNIDLTKEYILEPSCGDGAFLKEIVKNILKTNVPNKKEILETQIEAFEIDEEHYKKCIENLNAICAEHSITDINWNIHCTDTLKYNFEDKKYTLIIGNPPYIRLHNLDKEYREFLKKNFVFCKGTTDIYLAFYEKCIKLLSKTGKLLFITPNTFLRNVSFKSFRDYIYQECLLNNLKDFKSSKIFNVSTYCAIMTLTKNKNNSFTYEEYSMEKMLFSEEKDKELLNRDKWILTSSENESISNSTISINSLNHNIQYGVATLRDKIFITSDFELINEKICRFKDYIIETDLIKVAIKGSKIGRLKNTEYCIFPYKKTEDGYKPLTEDEMEENYPQTFKYFLDNKEELLKRDIDKNYTSWFQFGRSQGIQTMINDKIVIDPIVNPNGKVICLPADKNAIVYSGIFITGENLEEIREILTSKNFVKYVSLYGKDMQNGYKSLTTKIIKNYLKGSN